MCGLLGFLSNDRTAKEVRDDVAAALDLARHRGPDEGGTLHDEDTVLGFRRLSIIDLDNSHQPLPYDDGRYWLLFNGEIYNYLELRERLAREHGATFATDGDSEAILAAYQYLRRGLRPRAARDVRVPDLGHRGAGALRRARLVRHQAAVHVHRRRAAPFFGSEKKSLLELGGSAGADGAGHPLAAALPDPAVRAGAGDHAPADPPDRERHRVPAASGRRAGDLALLPADLPDPGGRRRAAALRRDPRGARGLRRQAHARGRHRRLVPVRRHRLDRHRRAGQAAQPAADHLHHRLRAGGLLARSTSPPSRRPRSASAHHQTVSAAGDDGHAAADRLVPRRPGGRPGPGPALLHRPRGPQARQGGAVRRGRGRAVRRLQHLPRAAVAARAHGAAGRRSARALGRVSRRLPRGMRGKDLLRRGVDPARGALLRQRPDLPRRRARLPAHPRPAASRSGTSPTRCTRRSPAPTT